MIKSITNAFNIIFVRKLISIKQRCPIWMTQVTCKWWIAERACNSWKRFLLKGCIYIQLSETLSEIFVLIRHYVQGGGHSWTTIVYRACCSYCAFFSRAHYFRGDCFAFARPLLVNLGSYISAHTIFKDTKRDFRSLSKHAHKWAFIGILIQLEARYYCARKWQ